MDDVSEEAQVAMSTVYKHFKDKRDLIASTTAYAFRIGKVGYNSKFLKYPIRQSNQ